MANNPWDREVFNLNERALSPDLNQVASYADQALRDFVLNLLAERNATNDDSRKTLPAANGAMFFGSGFKVRAVAVPVMQVTLDIGLGIFNDNTSASNVSSVSGLNDLSVLKPLSLTAVETITVPTADVTNPRIDIVEVALDRRLADLTARDVLNTSTGFFASTNVNKTLTYNQSGRSTVNGVGSINYKTGTAAAVPAAPATDAGYVKIAEIDVKANGTKIMTENIRDFRSMYGIGGALPFSFRVVVPRTPTSGGVATISQISLPPGMMVVAAAATAALYSATIIPHVGDASVYLIAGNNQNVPSPRVHMEFSNAQGIAGATAGLEMLAPLTSGWTGTYVPGPTFGLMSPVSVVGTTQACLRMDLISRFAVTGPGINVNIAYDISGTLAI